MDEYISREAVVRYLKGYSEHELNWNRNHGMITSSVLDKAERAISEMPAADVQPIKHGQWVLKSRQISDIIVKLPAECTECGFSEFNAQRYNFCPNCGLRMIKDGDSK